MSGSMRSCPAGGKAAAERPAHLVVHARDDENRAAPGGGLAGRVKLTTVEGSTPLTRPKSMTREPDAAAGEAVLRVLRRRSEVPKEESLQPDDQDGAAVPAQEITPLLRQVEGALVVLAGEDVADALDARVFDDEEGDGGGEADDDAGSEADADDDEEDEDDDQVFPGVSRRAVLTSHS